MSSVSPRNAMVCLTLALPVLALAGREQGPRGAIALPLAANLQSELSTTPWSGAGSPPDDPPVTGGPTAPYGWSSGSGNGNGNGNVGNFNGNGNSGNFNGNGNRSSGNGNGSSRDGTGNGNGRGPR